MRRRRGCGPRRACAEPNSRLPTFGNIALQANHLLRKRTTTVAPLTADNGHVHKSHAMCMHAHTTVHFNMRRYCVRRNTPTVKGCSSAHCFHSRTGGSESQAVHQVPTRHLLTCALWPGCSQLEVLYALYCYLLQVDSSLTFYYFILCYGT
ncbi:hypothetical protein FKM82_030386 [Ascaphus truei]